MYLLSTFIKARGWGEIYVFYVPVYASNSCRLQNICNSAPWGHTFRWVAEFGVIPVHRDTELFAYGGCGPVVSASHLTPLDRLDCTHQGKLRNTQVQHRTYIGYGLSTRVITSAVGRLRNVHVSRVHRQL